MNKILIYTVVGGSKNVIKTQLAHAWLDNTLTYWSVLRLEPTRNFFINPNLHWVGRIIRPRKSSCETMPGRPVAIFKHNGAHI